MTLSILFCGGLNYMLYDSESDSVLMVGTINETEHWKHVLETCEQQSENENYYARLREEYTDMLVKGGNSLEQAENFLKLKMPFLFT